MSDEKTYNVLTLLPNDGQKCLCFGHKTYCCKEDMDDEPDWHEVTFRFILSSYKIKKDFPQDIEASLLQETKMVEKWEIGPEFIDGKVIGITKWKPLNE